MTSKCLTISHLTGVINEYTINEFNRYLVGRRLVNYNHKNDTSQPTLNQHQPTVN